MISRIEKRLKRLEQGNGDAVVHIVAIDADGTQGPPCKVRGIGPDAFDYLAAIQPLVAGMESDKHEHN